MWIKAGSDVLSAFASGSRAAPSYASQSVQANFDSSGFTVATGSAKATASREEAATPLSPLMLGLIVLGFVAWSKFN